MTTNVERVMELIARIEAAQTEESRAQIDPTISGAFRTKYMDKQRSLVLRTRNSMDQLLDGMTDTERMEANNLYTAGKF